MSRRVAFSVLVLGAVACPEWAHAVTNCSVSADPVAFGSYDPLGLSPTESVGNVQVSCTLLGVTSLLVSYTILLSTGSGSSFMPRKMASGREGLEYNLYTNANRTTVWGDESAGTAIVRESYLLGLATVTRNYAIYGRLFARQNVPAGVYSDVITVTVNY